jgi:hypothetical protein
MPSAGRIQVALRFILCWTGSVAIGYAVFGGAIFHSDKSVFQFVATGAISGAAIAASSGIRSKNTLAVFIAGFLAVVTITGSTSLTRLSRDAVMVISVILAVQAGLRWDTVFPRVVVGKFVLWGAGFAFIQCVAVGLLAAVFGVAIDTHVIIQAATISVLIGMGVGFGYELSEFVGRRLVGYQLGAARKASQLTNR